MPTTSFPVWLILASVLTGLAGAVSLAFVLFVPMLFDAPGSESNPATVSLAASVVLFPVFCLLAIALSWWRYRAGHSGQAVFTALLPLLPVLAGALSIAALQVFYGGSFSAPSEPAPAAPSYEGEEVLAQVTAWEPKAYTDHYYDGTPLPSDVFVLSVLEPAHLAGVTVRAYYQGAPELDGRRFQVGDPVRFQLPPEAARDGIFLWDLEGLRFSE